MTDGAMTNEQGLPEQTETKPRPGDGGRGGCVGGARPPGLLAALAVAAALSSGCGSDEETTPLLPPEPKVFRHGVASGDPLSDAVILWTRVTPESEDSVEVSWSVATDPALEQIVDQGTVSTDSSRDYTVKLDLDGLAAATAYYYRFEALGERSAVGRTRTAPSGSAERLRFAVVSGARFPHGYFHAYRAIAERPDLDFVLHLGDYIYEYGSGYDTVRGYEPEHDLVTLADYRTRYAQYRRDADLQAVHRAHPMIALWDDHEVANNAWKDGAENHDEDSQGSYAERKQIATQVYMEWLPIREQTPSHKLFRTFHYGDLADLIVIDARHWGREPPAADGDDPLLDDESRTILGEDQEQWLSDELTSSTARYRLLGNQMMFGQLPLYLNTDAWDGYPFARERVFDVIEAEGIDNAVVLTGDIHSSWAMDLARDPEDGYDPETGQGSLGVEMVTPAVASRAFPEEMAGVADAIVSGHPHIKFAEVVSRGYLVMDLDAQRAQGAWFLFDQVEVTSIEQAAERFEAAWALYDGESSLREEPAAAEPPSNHPEPAPGL